MRCTRCDQLAIPQAVGQMPDGRLVFGWCLDCMEREGCARIKIAPGGGTLRRRLAKRRRRPLTMREQRAAGLALLALVLSLWGATLTTVGLWKTMHPTRMGQNALGPGMPSFLIGGGAALGAAGLTLSAIALNRARWFWRTLEWLLFACAMLVLVLGVVRYDPRQAPWLAAFAGFALALSGLVHQRHRLDLRAAQSRTAPQPSGSTEDDEEERIDF